jgi:hypothetical protein
MIAAFLSLVFWGALAWGLSQPDVFTATKVTPGAIAIGLSVLPAIFMPLLTLNFLWTERKVRAARRGENVIGRWTVSAAELAAFATNNAARNALGPTYHNEWKPPRKLPADGIEIIFAPDAVVAGRAFYALVTTGLFQFTSVHEVRESPPAIEFVVTTITTPHYRLYNALRLPVAPSARGELDRVIDHFRRVAKGRVIVDPDFYRPRIRFGLIVASVGAILAALGFWLTGQAGGDQDMENVALGLAVGSSIVAAAGLMVAAIAWTLRQRQYRG